MWTLLRETLRGLRRDRRLAAIIIVGLAVGVTDWQLGDLLWREQQHRGVRTASSLYVVEVARDRHYHPEGENDTTMALLNTGLAARDALELSSDPAISRSVLTGTGQVAVTPEGGSAEEQPVRFASSALFDMFGLPFRAGHTFRDDGAEAVLTEQLARQWFGPLGGVGRTLRIGGTRFTVSGVLEKERWPRRFDARLPKAEGIFLPNAAFDRLRPWPDPVLSTADPGFWFAQPRLAEDPWGRLFVEIPSDRRAGFEEFLRRWVPAQAGRRPTVLSARLLPWDAWEALVARAEGIYVVVRVMGVLMLAGCAVNLIRLAMVRFGARAHEMGIRRAMGATRRALLARQLVEAALLGLAAGVLGLFLLALSIPGFNSAIPPRPMDFFLDGQAVVASLLAGSASAVAASLLPVWRFSRMPPAALLRMR